MPLETRISWPAIFAGAFIAVGLQLLFVLLGTAIGLSVFDPAQADPTTTGATLTLGIYLLVTMLISFFIGGYATSRLGSIKFRPFAVLHGLAAWGLVMAFLTYSFGSPVSGLLGGAELMMDPTMAIPPEVYPP